MSAAKAPRVVAAEAHCALVVAALGTLSKTRRETWAWRHNRDALGDLLYHLGLLAIDAAAANDSEAVGVFYRLALTLWRDPLMPSFVEPTHNRWTREVRVAARACDLHHADYSDQTGAPALARAR